MIKMTDKMVCTLKMVFMCIILLKKGKEKMIIKKNHDEE
jgi:hypothetical protein